MRTALKVLLLAGLAAVAGCGGPSAKDFSLVPLEDPAKTVTLADFKGKTVLLDFWATWCGPCHKSMPEIQEMWTKYHDKGFEVVSISDESRNVVLEFHKSNPYTYPVYLDSGSTMSRAYGVEGIPRFILMRDGQVLWDQPGFEAGDIRSAVEQAMG
jgi:cytochrome c biogenesis protein CcmG, thiol:disulfide interchange protein DsbE